MDNATSSESNFGEVYPANSGQVVRLVCKFVGHPSNTNYSWYINGQQVTGRHRENGDKVSRNVLTTNLLIKISAQIKIQLLRNMQSQLTMENISEDDKGNYTCLAENAYGQGRFTYNLKVSSEYYGEHTRLSLIYVESIAITINAPSGSTGAPDILLTHDQPNCADWLECQPGV